MRQLNGRVFSCLLRAERGAEIAFLGGVGVQVRDVCNENCEERSKREKCEERE
jgi:hypothetical protein